MRKRISVDAKSLHPRLAARPDNRAQSVADRKDEQNPGPAGRRGHSQPQCGGTRSRPTSATASTAAPAAGGCPGAVAGTLAGLSAKGKASPRPRPARRPKPKGDDDGGWSWMPSPPGDRDRGDRDAGARRRARLGDERNRLLGAALDDPARVPPPRDRSAAAGTNPKKKSPKKNWRRSARRRSGARRNLRSGGAGRSAVRGSAAGRRHPRPAGRSEEEDPLQKSSTNSKNEEAEEAENGPTEEPLPEVKHAFLIVLGENGYEKPSAPPPKRPYLSRVLPKKGELLPNYYGVTERRPRQRDRAAERPGPDPGNGRQLSRTTRRSRRGRSRSSPNRWKATAASTARKSKSLPTQLTEAKELTWRAYVRGHGKRRRDRPAVPLPQADARRPRLHPSPTPGDQYVTWRNPVVYFAAIAEGGRMRKARRRLRSPDQGPGGEEEDAGAVADLPQRLPLGRRNRMRTGRAEGCQRRGRSC